MRFIRTVKPGDSLPLYKLVFEPEVNPFGTWDVKEFPTDGSIEICGSAARNAVFRSVLFNKSVDIAGDLIVLNNERLVLGGDLRARSVKSTSTIEVQGRCDIAQDFICYNPYNQHETVLCTFYRDFNVKGNVIMLASTLYVCRATIGGCLNARVTKAYQDVIKPRITVAGNAVFQDQSSVAGDVIVNGSVSAKGCNFEGSVSVDGNLNCYGISVDGDLTVRKNVFASDKLQVYWDANVGGDLISSGDVVVDGNLRVGGTVLARRVEVVERLDVACSVLLPAQTSAGFGIYVNGLYLPHYKAPK